MRKFDATAAGDMAITCRIITRWGATNIIRDAFEHAKTYEYPNVTIVEKPNVLRETSGLMIRVAREVAKQYPGIKLWETNIDAMTMWLIKNPEQYGVAGVLESLRRRDLRPLRAAGGRDAASPTAATSATLRRVRAHPRLRAKYAGRTR